MRRALVLGDEIARHPFLKTLPRHVRHGGTVLPLRQAPAHEPMVGTTRRRLVEGWAETRETGARWTHALWYRLRWQARFTDHITAKDVREFLMAYCACFLAVSAFIG